MGKVRPVVAFGLAVVSATAIVWCVVAARPVPLPLSPPSSAETRPWDRSGARAAVGQGREATTEVTLTRALPADLGPVPEGRLDDEQRQVRVTIVHRLLMAGSDDLAAALREGDRFPQQIRGFTDQSFGAIKVDGATLAPATRLAPVLTTSAGRTTVRFTITLLRQVRPGGLIRIDFNTPTARPPLVESRKVTLLPGEWTVLRAGSIQPDREERERLEFTVGPEPVSVTLAQDSHGFPDVPQDDDFSWTTALSVLTALVLVVFVLRALGPRWWRPPNRELVAGLALTAPVLLVSIIVGEGELLAYVLLFGVVPALALRHASRLLPAGPGWTAHDVLGAAGVGVLVALGMLT